jgi:hypothetical protein
MDRTFDFAMLILTIAAFLWALGVVGKLFDEFKP